MDNGQNTQNAQNAQNTQDAEVIRSDIDNPFKKGITSGVGAAAENDNPLTPTENLDSSDFYETSHNYGAIGNSAMDLSAQKPHQTLESNPSTDDLAKLGQIIDLSVPPLKDNTNTDTDHKESHDKEDPLPGTSLKEIGNRFSDNKISSADISFIKLKEQQYADSPNQFYEFWRMAKKAARKGQNE